MKKILARNFLKFTTNQIWEMVIGDFICVFDDGELVTNHKQMQYMSYFWDLHRMYPKTKMLMEHHIKSIINDGLLRSDTHLNLFSNIAKSVYEAYRDIGIPSIDTIARVIYEKTNEAYCDMSNRLEEYVVTLDVTDFIGIVAEPAIAKALDVIEPTQKSLDNTFKTLNDIIFKSDTLKHNPIAMVARAGLVNKNQLMQCVGPRGYGVDVDSSRFPKPILRGVVHGYRSLHDMLVESRSAAMALYYSKTPLQMAEYFSRRLQLLCQTLSNLHIGDCGSTHYLTLRVRDAEKENGVVVFEGDLPLIVGKYYLDERARQLKVVKATDIHLINTTLKIRSPIAGCAHPDPNGICSTCFGELAFSVPDNTNIGHMCSTFMTQQSSQSVLGTKHLVGSAVIDRIILTSEMSKYLKISHKGESYLLADSLNNKKITIKVMSRFATGISDIDLVKDITELNISRVSKIEMISMEVTDKNGNVSIYPAIVSVGKREASFTYDFLSFIKNKRWKVDDKSNYVFDLEGWDRSKEILTLPLKHTSTSEHSSEIADMIESSIKDLNTRDQAQNPQAILIELTDLINTKLNVNMAVVEVILHAACVRSMEHNDYRLPKAGTTSEVGVSKLTIQNRSLSAAMAYEEQRQISFSPEAFFYGHRPDHALDVFLKPREVLEAKKLAQGA